MSLAVVMYDDIIDLAMDQQLLTEMRGDTNYKKLPLWRELQKKESTIEFEEKLQEAGLLNFETIFHEPVGYHLIKSFLQTEHSVDKAVFVADVEIYKTLQDPRATENVSLKIYERFCAPEEKNTTTRKGMSVFNTTYQDDDDQKGNNIDKSRNNNHNNNNSADKDSEEQRLKDESMNELSLYTENTNSIGVYGRPIKRLKQKIDNGNPLNNIFDEIAQEVYNDLRLDVFPRFCRSHLYQMYLRCKSIEHATITIRDFHQMRMLGRGAFGCVNACKKKDTGKLYAMKQINKKRVSATESAETIMSERNFLADMNSVFVTTLKYAFMDGETLYLILDLMIGGDLKYHLNNDRTFNEDRTKFYAAQVLLGLDHMHSKGIIYRDLKLENVLVDEKGHCKISDLGLAIKIEKNKVKGYAGTPGYTAPEVVLSLYYDHIVDFFSLGVLIYRFICGKKPFQTNRRQSRRRPGGRQLNQRRKNTEIDRNVVEMVPDFPSQYFVPQAKSILKGLLCKNPKLRMGACPHAGINEIKQHAWFDSIDFGLLEAGYLNPPYVPALDEIHAAQHIGRPPNDAIYGREKLKPEFDEQLKEFPYVCKKVIQEEIVQVLKKVHDERRKSQADNCNTPFNFDNVDNGAPGTCDSCLGSCIIN